MRSMRPLKSVNSAISYVSLRASVFGSNENMAKKVAKVTKKPSNKASKDPTGPLKETPAAKDDQDNGTEKKYTCPYCNQAFARKYDMEKHSRKHTGDKPYKCGICGKQFVQGKCLEITFIFCCEKRVSMHQKMQNEFFLRIQLKSLFFPLRSWLVGSAHEVPHRRDGKS